VLGDGLLHPAVLIALCVLVLNDHLLKAAAPGLITGKLSDLAGMAFFPVLVVAAWEVGLAVLGRWREPTMCPPVAAILATGIAFVAVKTTPIGASAFGWALGALQWLLASPMRLATGVGPAQPVPSIVVVDPTDLIALPMLLVPLFVARQRARDTATPGSVRPSGADPATANAR
jgi:hypothetical protein